MGSAALGLMLTTMTAGAAAGAPKTEQMKITLDIQGEGELAGLEPFLAERVTETWGVPARLSRVLGADGNACESRCFNVTVTAGAGGTLLVRVVEAGETLVDRLVEVADPGAAKLTVWLLIKSTLNRALLQAEPGRKTEPRLSLATDKTKSETIAASRSTAAMKQTRVARRPWGLRAMVGFSLGSPRLFSIGPSVGVWAQPWRRLVLSGEAGYRLSPGVLSLILHHAPIRFDAGWEIGGLPPVVIGASGTVNPKWAVTRKRQRFVVGVEIGGFAQARMRLTRPGAEFLMRADFGLRPIRQRYVVNEGSIAEQPWELGFTTGVVWR